jgi:hypothetical protein
MNCEIEVAVLMGEEWKERRETRQMSFKMKSQVQVQLSRSCDEWIQSLVAMPMDPVASVAEGKQRKRAKSWHHRLKRHPRHNVMSPALPVVGHQVM